MDKNQIFELMSDAFKSLTVSHIEIVLLSKPYLKVRVVAERYAQKTIPERVLILNQLVREKDANLFKKFAVSFEPLTPSEFSEFFGDKNESSNTQNEQPYSKVSKEADI